ncbi:dephospho-CoA kinase [Bacillus salitolerans]|uniref:Dephospho-CoA kinase n=1 Tax=Bacillus salitolerans TaxID=1437434 RepID=A0ABW4LQ29_9BACI
MSSVIIGLTGGIASGKSTVSSMFKNMEIPVVDADIIARQVVEPSEKAYLEIIQTFGEGILREDKTINRDALGAIVFNNKEKREKLNSIVHPAVRNRMIEQKSDYIQQGKKAVVLDIPLLFESKLTHLVDKTILVYVDPDVQLERLVIRNQYTEAEAVARVNSQMPLSEKKPLADVIINNNGTIEETKQQLINILRSWDIL